MNRSHFPLLNQKPDLIYFDTAATAQLYESVLEAMQQYYTTTNANAGRGIYRLAESATQVQQDVRKQVAQFINARTSDEIIFTAGTTDGINSIARGWGDANVQAGDEIVLTQLEHHANYVPWQQLCARTGATFKVIPVDSNGQLMLADIESFITPRTKLVAITHVSNVLGVIPAGFEAVIARGRAVGALILIDGAQAVNHIPVDVRKLDCDFYVFSGHKLYGPAGIGVLYMKKESQSNVLPVRFGGGAVGRVTQTATDLLPGPACYEPGTLPGAQIAGLGAAINFLTQTGVNTIGNHICGLVAQLLESLQKFKQVKIIGVPSQLRGGGSLVSFTIDGIHPHDAAAFFDCHNIGVRAGHHCAQPLAQAVGYQACLRISFGIYNTRQEVDFFITALEKLLATDLTVKR